LVNTQCAVKQEIAWNEQSSYNLRHMSITPFSLFLETGTKVRICLDQGLSEGLVGSLFNHKEAPAVFV